MRLGAFVTKIHEEKGVAADAIRDALLAASRKTVHDVLGAQPRVEVAWNEDLGIVEFKQVLTAVETVTQPYRELSLESLRALGADFEGIAAGEEIEVTMFHREEDAEGAAQLDAMFGGLLRLSSFQRSLDAPLADAWIGVIHAHLPPRAWPDGTVGALFQRGGWLAGTRGESDGVALSIAKTTWKERPLTPDDATVAFGFELRIERWGRSLDLPMEARSTLAELSSWAPFTVAESRRAAVETALTAAAKSLAGETSIDRLDGPDFVTRVVAALRSRA